MAGTQKNAAPSYVPHKIRSHPFKCITLPFHFVLLFILFWFAIFPLVFVNVHSKYTKHYKTQWSENWSYYFWMAAFLLYLFLLCILICFWRHTPNYEYVEDPSEGSAGIRRHERRIRKHGSLKTLNKTGGVKTDNCSGSTDGNACFIDLKESDVPDERSHKIRPATLCFEDEKNKTKVVLEYVPSPLTPREQFFFDLLIAANQSVMNATISFIDNEKLNCEKERLSCSSKSYAQLSEYFIANVPDRDGCCRSEAFVFVEDI